MSMFRRVAGASMAVTIPCAYNAIRCDTGKPPNPFDTFSIPAIPNWVSSQTAYPLMGGGGFGGTLGFVSGFTCKKIGRAVGVIVGGLYVMFQTAAYYEYIKINWDNVQRDATAVFDINKDGKIDEADLEAWYLKTLDILSKNQDDGLAAKNAAAGSFGVGFLYGLRKG